MPMHGFRLTRRDPRQTIFHQRNRRCLTALKLTGRLGGGEQIETTRSSVCQRSCIACQIHLPSLPQIRSVRIDGVFLRGVGWQ